MKSCRRAIEVALRSLIRFIGVGAAGAAGYVLLASLLNSAGLQPAGASLCGYAMMIPLVYPAQRRIAFRSNEPHLKAFPKYVATQLFGLQLSGLLPYLASFGPSLPPTAIFAALSIAIAGLNFLLLKFWAFARD
jgi:putative flippase GtrA